MGLEKPLTGAERVARRRAALRAQGLKPRTFWLPDPTSEAFREQARQDVEALNAWYVANPEEIAWIEAMTADALSSLPSEDHDY